jgi:hypothetical protein
MCTVLLPPGVNPIAVKYIISYIKLARKVIGGFCMIGSNTMKIGILILLSESIFLKYLISCICISNRTGSLMNKG